MKLVGQIFVYAPRWRASSYLSLKRYAFDLVHRQFIEHRLPLLLIQDFKDPSRTLVGGACPVFRRKWIVWRCLSDKGRSSCCLTKKFARASLDIRLVAFLCLIDWKCRDDACHWKEDVDHRCHWIAVMPIHSLGWQHRRILLR